MKLLIREADTKDQASVFMIEVDADDMPSNPVARIIFRRKGKILSSK